MDDHNDRAIQLARREVNREKAIRMLSLIGMAIIITACVIVAFSS